VRLTGSNHAALFGRAVRRVLLHFRVSRWRPAAKVLELARFDRAVYDQGGVDVRISHALRRNRYGLERCGWNGRGWRDSD
jgi:hypothetical protein